MIVGGAQENTLLNCLDLFRDHGDEVLLLTGEQTGSEGSLLDGKDLPFEVRYVPALLREIHPTSDGRAYNDLKAHLKEWRPDVVHTHSAKAGILGRAAAKASRVSAIIHSVHGAPFHPYQSTLPRTFYKFCERRAARWCDKLICVADAMVDLLVEHKIAPREKCVAIYSGMELQPYLDAAHHRTEMRRRFGFSDDHFVIGKVARLFELKGHDDLILAAERILATNSDARFLLVGDGKLRVDLEEEIRHRGMEAYFHFAGLVPPGEVPRYLGCMDTLVHLSLREGLARALPQALLAGLPVISYDIDGAREVVMNDQTGFLLPPRDWQAVAEAALTLAADPQLRKRLGQTGRELCRSRFDHHQMTVRIRQVYEEVLQSKTV